MGRLRSQVIVSCEHASNRLPDGLELDPALLDLHIAWDPGALVIAERLAERFDAPLFQGEVSRLVVDLNRTLGNRVLMRKVSDGHRIPFNYGLSTADVQERIARWYRPYREAVIAGAEAAIERSGRCLHLCIHTFTPALAGTVRGNDVGLLHDPAYGVERELCGAVRAHMQAAGDWTVWFNRPYSGTADGILPAMRRHFTPETFVGLELEVNQRHAHDRAALLAITDDFADGILRAGCMA